jgi:glycosyltransferase involved in cell wall biosynthesis
VKRGARLLVSKFKLGFDASLGVSEIGFQLTSLRLPRFAIDVARLLRVAGQTDVIFISNPKFPELVFIWLAKKLCRRPPRVVLFDLILRAPRSGLQKMLAPVQRRLLRAADRIVFIHRDISAYEKFFGVARQQVAYVPFKANNFDLRDSFAPVEGDYIVALGASHRDYRLLIEAVSGTAIPLKIIVPRASVLAHNADIGTGALPPNVEHVDTAVDRMAWSRYMAQSRFVVVPLLPDVLQPAGISVYLEAMVLGKPVVITRGASTEGILDDQLAVIVPAGDSQAMRRALVQLWNDAARRRQLAADSRAYALSLGDHGRLVDDLRHVVEACMPPAISSPARTSAGTD